jgi:hypothetical protein
MSNINLQDRIRQLQRGRTQSNLSGNVQNGALRPMDANPSHAIPSARPMDANPWRIAQPTAQPSARPMDATPWRTAQPTAQPSARPMDATPWRTQAPNPANAVGGPVQQGSAVNQDLAKGGMNGPQFASSMSGFAQPLTQQQMMQHDMAQRANPQIRGALPAGANLNPVTQLTGTFQGGPSKEALPQQNPKYGSPDHINAFAQQAMQHGFDPATIAQFIKGQLLQQ